MEKSKTIEELFLHIVVYTYLIIPLTFVFTFKLWRRRAWGWDSKTSLNLAVYGILFFILLFFYIEYKKNIPKEYRKLYQLLYTYLEYIFFTSFLWTAIKSKKFKKIMIFFSFLFLLFQIQYFFRTELSRLDSVPIGIETILLFIYVLYFFYEFYKKENTYFIINNYCFWISIGILIYLGGSFFFYISINQLNEQQVSVFGTLTYCAEIVKNILFAISIFVFVKSPIENEKKQTVPYLDMI